MERMAFNFEIKKTPLTGQRIVCGVVGSGNLEVIIEPNNTTKAQFEIETSVENYKTIWAIVIEDFVKEYQPAGLNFILNDNGATPPVVMLRLKQAFELFTGYRPVSTNYLELSALQRIESILEPNSFKEWLANEKFYSPHLTALNIPCEADDGVIIGSGKLEEKSVLIAAQKKDFMGGGVGEVHGAKLTGLFRAAVQQKVAAVILLIDSGGVRLHEANAGEIAISEIIRAIFDAREQGIITLGVICGKNGAFGGMGIVSGCLDHLLINEIGRIGVSGPEVIQAVKGIEAFDAQDRGLIWRVYGGKTRYLQHVAHTYVGADMNEISMTIKNILTQPQPITLDFLKQQHALLKNRFDSSGIDQEEGEFLERKYPHLAENIFDLNKENFLMIASKIQSLHEFFSSEDKSHGNT